MKVRRVEQRLIQRKDKSYKELDSLCFRSKKLYNDVLHVNRQIFFSNLRKEKRIRKKYKNSPLLEEKLSKFKKNRPKLLSYIELASVFKTHPSYLALPAKVSQHVLKLADQAWISYFEHLKVKKPDEWISPPNYKGSIDQDREDGRQVLFYTYQAISYSELKKGKIKLSGTNLVFRSKVAKLATKHPDKYKINGVRLVPHLDYIMLEVVYTMEVEPASDLDPRRIAAIDLGINNLATVVFNFCKEPVIFNGKPVKSLNRYYNKLIAKARSELERVKGDRKVTRSEGQKQKQDVQHPERNVPVQNVKQKTSHHIRSLYRRRKAKINHFLHNVSQDIVQLLVENQVSTLFIGYNVGWKQGLNLGSKMNQKFAYIPFLTLINMIKYKAEAKGVTVLLQEESYTSKASYLDFDQLPTYQKGVKHKGIFSGKRVKRGLYKTKEGILVNADVNGALNIMRKGLYFLKTGELNPSMIKVIRRDKQRILAFVVKPVMAEMPYEATSNRIL